MGFSWDGSHTWFELGLWLREDDTLNSGPETSSDTNNPGRTRIPMSARSADIFCQREIRYQQAPNWPTVLDIMYHSTSIC